MSFPTNQEVLSLSRNQNTVLVLQLVSWDGKKSSSYCSYRLPLEFLTWIMDFWIQKKKIVYWLDVSKCWLLCQTDMANTVGLQLFMYIYIMYIKTVQESPQSREKKRPLTWTCPKSGCPLLAQQVSGPASPCFPCCSCVRSKQTEVSPG